MKKICMKCRYYIDETFLADEECERGKKLRVRGCCDDYERKKKKQSRYKRSKGV